MKKFVFGTTTIKLEGVNFQNLLQELKIKNIKLKKIKIISPRILSFQFKSNQRAKVFAILNKKCYTILEQKESKISTSLQILSKRIGIICGLIFGVLLNFVATFFVWDIKLFGDQSLSEEIEYVLNQNKIKKGTLKQNINAQQIENLLYENVSSISLVGVSFKGSTILINYTKRFENEIQEENHKNIIAKDDGIVASILTISGTAMVKPNEYVKKGQILIAGFETNGEEKIECNAKGQVFAYVWKSSTLEYPQTKIELARTGNYVENYKITYKNNILTSTNNEVLFDKFEQEEEIQNLTNSLIPIKITYTKSFELQEVLTTQNFEENKEKLLRQAKLIAWENINGDEDILEEKTEINFVSNIWFITHYIKIKEKIS